MGKNAPFNLSAANTVFYASSFLDDNGDRQHCSIGKAQLATHEDPQQAGRVLQHIGFCALHDIETNQPVEGLQIPEPFRLDEQGTAIFIIGFQGELLPSWASRTIRAAAENFFYAIHHRTLTVEVIDPYTRAVKLDHETLPGLTQREFSDSPVRHYVDAIAHQDTQRIPGKNSEQSHQKRRLPDTHNARSSQAAGPREQPRDAGHQRTIQKPSIHHRKPEPAGLVHRGHPFRPRRLRQLRPAV